MRYLAPIPTDVLLEKFDTLSGELRITPEQLGMILGISAATLQRYRDSGKPLPHVREGAKVLYRIKDVRKYIKTQPVYDSTWDFYIAKKEAYLNLPLVSKDDVDDD